MKIFKTIIDFYINSSIHVGLSCYALVRITQMRFHISHDESMANFALFGTIVGYNFVKYDALARTKKLEMRNQLKTIALFSFCSLLLAGYYFFCLQKTTQLFSILVLGLTLLYTLPFFPNKKKCPKLGRSKNLYCGFVLGWCDSNSTRFECQYNY